MPALRTEITEIATGLAMLPFDSVEEGLGARPPELVDVAEPRWERLAGAVAEPDYRRDFANAWANGKAFLHATEGLRGRRPLRIEWKGPHHTPGYDLLPADLRIDHVFLVSCKYLSRVLANPSPAHLFQRALASRGDRSPVDWFLAAAPEAYRSFYGEVRATLAGEVALPERVEALEASDRAAIKARCGRRWPASLEAAYEEFSGAVSRASASTWAAAVPALADREVLLWRLLRLTSAPYFILGSRGDGHLRLRVATPADWRRRFALRSFDIVPRTGAQPGVDWLAAVADRETAVPREVRGHVEVRWSHGRFCGFPEAKVYLDTPHREVPGYVEIA